MSRVVIDRAVVEQAMKAMLNFPGDISDEMFESIRALKAALAEPAQEPVAYIHRQGNHWEVSERELVDDERARGWTEEPLYIAPPQRRPLVDPAEYDDAGAAERYNRELK